MHAARLRGSANVTSPRTLASVFSARERHAAALADYEFYGLRERRFNAQRCRCNDAPRPARPAAMHAAAVLLVLYVAEAAVAVAAHSKRLAAPGERYFFLAAASLYAALAVASIVLMQSTHFSAALSVLGSVRIVALLAASHVSLRRAIRAAPVRYAMYIGCALVYAYVLFLRHTSGIPGISVLGATSQSPGVVVGAIATCALFGAAAALAALGVGRARAPLLFVHVAALWVAVVARLAYVLPAAPRVDDILDCARVFCEVSALWCAAHGL